MLLILFAVFHLAFSQNVKDKYEAKQPQDLNVPPPPTIAFPSQYPKGNKFFVEEIKKNLSKDILNTNQNLKAKIILKIANDGTVLNISAYGSNENLNSEVKKVAQKTTENVKWIPGKNKQGQNVIDIVSLPIDIKKK